MENETEEFYVNPIKEKSYELASHISPNGVIDEKIDINHYIIRK